MFERVRALIAIYAAEHVDVSLEGAKPSSYYFVELDKQRDKYEEVSYKISNILADLDATDDVESVMKGLAQELDGFDKDLTILRATMKIARELNIEMDKYYAKGAPKEYN